MGRRDAHRRIRGIREFLTCDLTGARVAGKFGMRHFLVRSDDFKNREVENRIANYGLRGVLVLAKGVGIGGNAHFDRCGRVSGFRIFDSRIPHQEKSVSRKNGSGNAHSAPVSVDVDAH